MRKLRPIASLLALAILSLAILAPTAERSLIQGRPVFEVDGQGGAFVRSIEGGDAVATVVKQPAGPDGVVHKAVGPIKPTDLVVELSPGEMPAFLQSVLSGKASSRFTCTVSNMNQDKKVARQRVFTNAAVTEIEVPAMDGSSKDAGYLTVKLSPQAVTTVDGASAKAISVNEKGEKGKPWMSGNFKLTIDGVDCTKVAKIEGFTLKQSLASEAVGDGRAATKVRGGWEVPNLVFSVSEAGAGGFVTWFDEFAVKGKADQKKNGKIEFMANDMKTVIFSLEAHGVGIIAVREGEAEANSDKVSRREVECFVEQWTVGK